jgi:hypothetical protein
MRGKLSAVLATAATATVLAGGATSAAASTVAVNDGWGCPSGYVCIIAPDGATMVNKYYTYGVHNLSGKIGRYYVDNNQTGGATVNLCYGYNGEDCTGPVIRAGSVLLWNLTPMNSIRLNRP